MKLKYSEFREAFSNFLVFQIIGAQPAAFGNDAQPFRHAEIKIVLQPSGSGYIHEFGKDSITVDFSTMDHYTLQGMPTPEQRDWIGKMTKSQANQMLRDKNETLTNEINLLKEQLATITKILKP